MYQNAFVIYFWPTFGTFIHLVLPSDLPKVVFHYKSKDISDLQSGKKSRPKATRPQATKCWPL